MSAFNVRVYGLLINENDEILISDEEVFDVQFTKFPGGGLEFGEGLIDALKREFIEECNLPIGVKSHFYTTDFYEKSSFNDTQILSIYYLVDTSDKFTFPIKSKLFDYELNSDVKQSFRLVKIKDLNVNDVTFRTDRVVVKMLKEIYG